MPKFTIITPTLQRDSLVQCCASIDSQTFTDWEHLVRIDRLPTDYPLLNRCMHANRIFSVCEVEHHNYGNTCRHEVWEDATGEWLLYIDDDNMLADPHALSDLAFMLDGCPTDWAIIPMLRHGSLFFNDPPGLCMTDTGNVVVKREIGRWPNMPDYTADGHWVEALKASHPKFARFPDLRPIIVMPKSSEGK